MKDTTLIEAKRLHALGFAIHWIRPNSKIPLESGWTTGPRKEWKYLERTYKKSLNVGVRLGEPSRLEKGYLAVVDVDVKSSDPRYIEEALGAVKKIIGKRNAPVVLSGRGNGSRHYYILTAEPFKTYTPYRSEETVKAHIPSRSPTKRELKELNPEELKKGLRLSAAWEVALYSSGRQVVLPPSVHPDSGRRYHWARDVVHQEIPLLLLPGSAVLNEGEKASKPVAFDFEPQVVDLEWLPISDRTREGIMTGKDVADRSAFLLKASQALLSAELTRNEILSVLTDRKTFLGEVGFDHAKTDNRKRAALWIYDHTLKKVQSEKAIPEAFKTEVIPPRKMDSWEIEIEAEEILGTWEEDLIRDKSGKPCKLLQNVFLILSNSGPSPVVRRDEFCYRDAYTCDTPWGGKKHEILSDGDTDEAQLWIGKTHKFEPSKNLIESAFTVMARQNAFDPVKDFLEGLPEWDGVMRLDTWLAENFEAEGDPEYLGQVFRKWMVAMVMRVYLPGAKFDWMPIFEGAQGIGKSSFGRLLVGDKFFLDWLPNLHDKDSALALQGMWGVEMGELSQFRRNELETIKAFITRTVDKMRPPFGKRLIESARRCVFFGTTNRETYLIDETGNRRFKPVVVGNLDFKALKRDRLQLFSEARQLFWTGKESEITLELSGRARTFERQIHKEKMVEDDSNSMEESMRNFIEKVQDGEVKFELEKFKIIDLFEGVGPFGGWRRENRNLQFAAKMLKRMGATDRMVHGRKHWEIDNDLFF